MHAITHEGCTDTVRDSAPKVDSGRKIPCRTGESNLPQRRAGSTLYRLSYISIPQCASVVYVTTTYCVSEHSFLNGAPTSQCVVSYGFPSESKDTELDCTVEARLKSTKKKKKKKGMFW